MLPELVRTLSTQTSYSTVGAKAVSWNGSCLTVALSDGPSNRMARNTPPKHCVLCPAPLEITDILGELRGMKDAPPLVGGEELSPGASSPGGTRAEGDKSDQPYRSNMEYLEDRFQLLALQVHAV